jgi:hypothetical protein
MKKPMWGAGVAFATVVFLSGALWADRDDRDERLEGNDA